MDDETSERITHPSARAMDVPIRQVPRYEDTGGLTIKRVQTISTLRSRRWHKDGENEWSVLEWTGSMCGEAGEAAGAYLALAMCNQAGESANTAKKIRRHDLEMVQGSAHTFAVLCITRHKRARYSAAISRRKGVTIE